MPPRTIMASTMEAETMVEGGAGAEETVVEEVVETVVEVVVEETVVEVEVEVVVETVVGEAEDSLRWRRRLD